MPYRKTYIKWTQNGFMLSVLSIFLVSPSEVQSHKNRARNGLRGHWDTAWHEPECLVWFLRDTEHPALPAVHREENGSTIKYTCTKLHRWCGWCRRKFVHLNKFFHLLFNFPLKVFWSSAKLRSEKFYEVSVGRCSAEPVFLGLKIAEESKPQEHIPCRWEISPFKGDGRIQ